MYATIPAPESKLKNRVQHVEIRPVANGFLISVSLSQGMQAFVIQSGEDGPAQIEAVCEFLRELWRKQG